MTPTDLERLYDSHAGGLYRYLLRFVASPDAARDLLQDVFVKASPVPLPQALKSERAWLYRFAHNAAIDHLRRERVRHPAAREDHGASIAPAVDPDSPAIASELRQALDTLPPEQRSILELKLWEGLTFEEISTVQDISLNTAASRYRYGLEKMRTTLRPLYDELK